MGNPKVASGVITLKDQGGGVWGSVPVIPLVSEGFESGVLGERLGGAFLPWVESTYDNTRAYNGGQSAKIHIRAGQGFPVCGGNNNFAGEIFLPQEIPVGKRIWLAMRMYNPSTLTGGYIYSTSDQAEYEACGFTGDSGGSALLKHLSIGPSQGSSRIYTLTALGYRDVVRLPNTRLIMENGANLSPTLPSPVINDEWYVEQLEVFVSNTGSGYARHWINDQFIGELTGATVDNITNTISRCGVGSFWNGVPYTDGAEGREDFWIDNFTVYSDIDGYGAPTGVDSGGRTYIDPFREV